MAFKMKNAALKKQADMAGCPRTAAKMKEAPMKMKKSPMEKELVGNQDNLPTELKAKIEAAPAKMRNRKGAMETEAPLKMKKSPMEKDGTKFTDKLKAAGKALKDNVGKRAGHGGIHNTLTRKISRSYKEYKKGYREADEKKAPTKMKKGEPMKMSHESGAKMKKGETTRVVDGGSKMAKRAKADYEKDQAKKKAKAEKKKAFDKVSSDARANHARQAKAEGLTMAEYKKKLKKRMRGF